MPDKKLQLPQRGHSSGGFSGCIWEENDFEGADMLHSVFAEEELPFIHLKPEQLQLILVDRGRQE